MPKRKSPEGSGAIDAERIRLDKQAGGPSQTPYDGPRSVLLDFNSMDKLVATLKACKRVVVVTGAGISVSCGIPDFRSENGIYNIVSKLDLGLGCAEDLFDLEFFMDDPAPFFKFARALYPGNYVPSLTHRFLKTLEVRGKLLRNFTQNIDGLEAQVGLTKYVACHGSFLTATCLSCKAKWKAEDIKAEVMRQEVPLCSKCGTGVVKPDITFFGEKLPAAVRRAVEADHKKADLLLVLGTSLKVAPVSRILQFIPRSVPQVSVNREIVRPPATISEGFDMHLVGDCDDVVQYLCWRLGWDLPPLPPGAYIPADASTSACHAEERPRAALGRAPSEGKVEGVGVDSGSSISSTGTNVHYPPPYTVLELPNIYYFPSSVQWKERSVVGAGAGAGAGASSANHGHAENNASDSAEEFTEVITCDACDKKIDRDAYTCQKCFGYDLCASCYAGGRHPHARRSGHCFRLVDAAPALSGQDAGAVPDGGEGL